MKKLMLVAILVMATALIGCEAEKANEEQAAAQAENTAPVNIFEVQTKWLSDFKVGGDVAPNGTATDVKATFAPGETIWYSVVVKDPPPASAVELLWVGPNGAKVGRQMKGIAPGQDVVFFQSPDTTAWPPGAYEAQIWVVDEKVNAQKFTIVGPETATATTTDTAAKPPAAKK
jgi:hypothetical protein